MKLLFFATLCYGFFWPEPIPGHVEWRTGWKIFRLTNDILDYHFGTKHDCAVEYQFLRQTVVITCPPNRQPPSLLEAWDILDKIPKAIERERKREQYSGINLYLQDILIALWNRCGSTNATWNEIIDQI